MSSLAALRSVHMMSMVLPAGRFFKPRELFWSLLLEEIKKGITFVECGSGSGELLDEAHERHIEIAGFDICKREGQSRRVCHGDATQLHWGPTRWPLICRPSHDGFANEIVEAARECGATTWFITKPENYDRDLSFYHTKKLASNVGHERERLWAISPLKDRK